MKFFFGEDNILPMIIRKRLYPFARIFVVTIIFAYLIGLVIAYASLYEWIGLLILGLVIIFVFLPTFY